MKEHESVTQLKRIKEIMGVGDHVIAKHLRMAQPSVWALLNGQSKKPQPKNQRKIDRLLAKLEAEQ
jgi:hypothetical protein